MELRDIEGFVVYLKNGITFKAKTQWYLTQHRARDQINVPRRLFEAVIYESTDDLKSLFHDNPQVIQQIIDMEQRAGSIYNTLVSTVETFVTANQSLIDNDDRKQFAILGQQQLSKVEFGLAMQLYSFQRGQRTDPPNYKEICVKYWKQFGIEDDPEIAE